MDATDLMVGDWVLCTYSAINKPVRVVGITSVYDNELKIIVNDGESHLVFQEKYIEPTPLTTEILEKNGFRRETECYRWAERLGGYMGQTTSATTPIEIIRFDEGHCIVSNPHDGRMFQGDVTYVHQLQHALKICEIKKNIVL